MRDIWCFDPCFAIPEIGKGHWQYNTITIGRGPTYRFYRKHQVSCASWNRLTRIVNNTSPLFWKERHNLDVLKLQNRSLGR